ncbi:MAG: hypothetical protein OJF49_003032 [Ktedonobacterales bacterium]|jgi:hypothetical protein|nr:MAG: hypothetical protein OJF49_003032 [Ktedonobacterales bacterium]
MQAIADDEFSMEQRERKGQGHGAEMAYEQEKTLATWKM